MNVGSLFLVLTNKMLAKDFAKTDLFLVIETINSLSTSVSIFYTISQILKTLFSLIWK